MKFLKDYFLSDTKRLTSKGLPIFDHNALGKCVIITKERHNGKWSLVGGGVNGREGAIGALKRELKEEFGEKVKIILSKALPHIETTKQKNYVHAIQLSGKLDIDYNELETIGFYPLEDKWENERLALEKNMDNHARIGLRNFLNNHDYDSYRGSKVKIEEYIFNDFHKTIQKIMNKK